MQMLGKAFIKIDGRLLKTKEGAKLNVGGVEREPVIGNEVHGYTEKAVAPFIECSINVDGQINLAELGKITDATVTFEADTGQTWVLRNAWIEKPAELTANAGGEVGMKFFGISCEQL
jgi:hypothetical protein